MKGTYLRLDPLSRQHVETIISAGLAGTMAEAIRLSLALVAAQIQLVRDPVAIPRSSPE